MSALQTNFSRPGCTKDGLQRAGGCRAGGQGQASSNHVVEMSHVAIQSRCCFQAIGADHHNSPSMLANDRRYKSLTCSAGPAWRCTKSTPSSAAVSTSQEPAHPSGTAARGRGQAQRARCGLHILQIGVSTWKVDCRLCDPHDWVFTSRQLCLASVSRNMLRYRTTARRPTAATGMSSIYRRPRAP
jgi:hypothetical protein